MLDTHLVTDLASLRAVLSLRRNSRVLVALPSLDEVESISLQRRMNRLLSECGCSLSAAALLGCMLACAFFDAAHWPLVVAHIWKAIAINLVACFAAGGFGRSAGLLRARWQLARTVKTTEVELRGMPSRDPADSFFFARSTPWDA